MQFDPSVEQCPDFAVLEMQKVTRDVLAQHVVVPDSVLDADD